VIDRSDALLTLHIGCYM